MINPLEPISPLMSSDLSKQLDSFPEQGDNDDLLDKRLEAHEHKVRHWLKIGALAFLAISGACLIGTYIAHLVLPATLQWLDQTQIDKIKDFVISIVSGLAMSFSIKYFTK